MIVRSEGIWQIIDIYPAKQKGTHEVELKFPETQEAGIAQRLQEIGARREHDRMMYMVTFEGTTDDGIRISGFDSHASYLRLRQSNDNLRLTYKTPDVGRLASDRRELEVDLEEMSIFEAWAKIERIEGLRGWGVPRRRVHWTLPARIAQDAHVEIEDYGFIPTFIEIETTSEDDMITACNALGLDINQGKKGMVTEIYPEEFTGYILTTPDATLIGRKTGLPYWRAMEFSEESGGAVPHHDTRWTHVVNRKKHNPPYLSGYAALPIDYLL